MFHKYIMPMISVIIIATVNVTMNAIRTWNPINRNVIAKIEAVEKIVVSTDNQCKAGNSGGGGKITCKGRCSGLAHDPHGKLGLRLGQSQRRDICMSCTCVSVY
jgi:hypothetical protein